MSYERKKRNTPEGGRKEKKKTPSVYFSCSVVWLAHLLLQLVKRAGLFISRPKPKPTRRACVCVCSDHARRLARSDESVRSAAKQVFKAGRAGVRHFGHVSTRPAIKELADGHHAGIRTHSSLLSHLSILSLLPPEVTTQNKRIKTTTTKREPLIFLHPQKDAVRNHPLLVRCLDSGRLAESRGSAALAVSIILFAAFLSSSVFGHSTRVGIGVARQGGFTIGDAV